MSTAHVSGQQDFDRPLVIVLIPAHNEQALIRRTLESVFTQTRWPDIVLVIADNCTDATASIAVSAGAQVLHTVGNRHKKAGALNQALDYMLLTADDRDYVLCMDADSVLSPTFIETALRGFTPEVGAVGGLFYGLDENNLLKMMQGNEYARYSREISRRRTRRANVLTGTGSLFRVDVLRELQAARAAGKLPGSGIYQMTALTEDNEITLAIKHLGYRAISPRAATLQTNLPATLGSLWHQRLRWHRGAMENLREYGITKVTLPYLFKLGYTSLATVVTWLYLYILIAMLIIGTQIALSPVWSAVFGVYLFERWWAVRTRSWRAQVLALIFPLEMLYDFFQQGVLVKAAVDFARRGEQRWIH